MLRDDGSITGNVSDQTGAALPGATVEVVNTETGVLKSATTDERGAYLLSDLQPGTYSITIQLAGFRPATQKDARLASNAVLRVDARLELAGVLETAEVIGTSPVLQTDRGDIHITQTARQINDLPLTGSAGRNYQMTLVPGAVLAGEQNSAAGSPQRSISFNVNGVSRLQNNTRLDGASIVYPWLPTNTAYVPSAEAIEEVSIATNSFNAEQGLAGGASINVVIKSGTNNVRGTAWGYNSDYDLRARNFFLAPNAPKPAGYLNQFGGNLGGPIMKNKLFFFANWERTRRENIAPIREFSLATDALRRGDFSATGVTIYDPASTPDPALRTPFPGNVIPQNRFDPAAVELIRRLPLLNNGTGFTNNYRAQGTEDFKRDNNDFKVTGAQRVLRSQRIRGREHPRRPAAAFRSLRTESDPGAGILEHRLRAVPHGCARPREAAVPRRGDQRPQPCEFGEPRRRHLERGDVRVHYIDHRDG